jgi:hypothetical protein
MGADHIASVGARQLRTIPARLVLQSNIIRFPSAGPVGAT